MVVTANPRARRSAGSTLAIAALSGPTLMKSKNRAANIAGQKTAGVGERTAKRVNTSEVVSDHPDTANGAPRHRLASRSLSAPPIRVPANPATTSRRPNVEAAVPSGRFRSRTKYVGIQMARPPRANV